MYTKSNRIRMMLYTNQIRMLLFKTECWSTEDFNPEEEDQQDAIKSWVLICKKCYCKSFYFRVFFFLISQSCTTRFRISELGT